MNYFPLRFDKSENIPYTVVLFILGFIIAAASRTNISNAFIDSIQSWIHIDPELILFVFLPPLIFGEVIIHLLYICFYYISFISISSFLMFIFQTLCSIILYYLISSIITIILYSFRSVSPLSLHRP